MCRYLILLFMLVSVLGYGQFSNQRLLGFVESSGDLGQTSLSSVAALSNHKVVNFSSVVRPFLAEVKDIEFSFQQPFHRFSTVTKCNFMGFDDFSILKLQGALSKGDTLKSWGLGGEIHQFRYSEGVKFSPLLLSGGGLITLSPVLILGMQISEWDIFQKRKENNIPIFWNSLFIKLSESNVLWIQSKYKAGIDLQMEMGLLLKPRPQFILAFFTYPQLRQLNLSVAWVKETIQLYLGHKFNLFQGGEIQCAFRYLL